MEIIIEPVDIVACYIRDNDTEALCLQAQLFPDTFKAGTAHQQLTPLMVAAALGKLSAIDCLFELASARLIELDPEAKAERDMTAHMIVANTLLISPKKAERDLAVQVLNKLQALWPDTHIAAQHDNHNSTILSVAAEEGVLDTTIASWFPDPQAWITPDIDGDTPFFLACQSGSLPTVKLVAQQAAMADPKFFQSRNKNDYTALLIAAAKGHLPVISYLMENFDINLSATNHCGDSLLLLGVWSRQDDVVRYLCEHLPEAEKDQQFSLAPTSGLAKGHPPILAALRQHSPKMADMLFKTRPRDFQLQMVNQYNASLLWLAVEAEHDSLVQQVLLEMPSAWVDWAMQTSADNGETPLACAIQHKKYAMVKRLLQHYNINKLPLEINVVLLKAAATHNDAYVLGHYLTTVTDEAFWTTDDLDAHLLWLAARHGSDEFIRTHLARRPSERIQYSVSKQLPKYTPVEACIFYGHQPLTILLDHSLPSDHTTDDYVEKLLHLIQIAVLTKNYDALKCLCLRMPRDDAFQYIKNPEKNPDLITAQLITVWQSDAPDPKIIKCYLDHMPPKWVKETAFRNMLSSSKSIIEQIIFCSPSTNTPIEIIQYIKLVLGLTDDEINSLLRIATFHKKLPIVEALYRKIAPKTFNTKQTLKDESLSFIHGQSTLYLAILRNQLDIVMWLKDNMSEDWWKWAMELTPNEPENSLFETSILHSDPEISDFLIPDWSTISSDQRATSLLIAAVKGNLPCFRKLYLTAPRNFDFKLTNSSGDTLLWLMVTNEHKACIEWYFKHASSDILTWAKTYRHKNTSTSPIVEAVVTNNPAIFKLFAPDLTNLSHVDIMLLFMFAVKHNNVAALDTLKASAFDLPVALRGTLNLLNLAIHFKHLPVIEWLADNASPTWWHDSLPIRATNHVSTLEFAFKKLTVEGAFLILKKYLEHYPTLCLMELNFVECIPVPSLLSYFRQHYSTISTLSEANIALSLLHHLYHNRACSDENLLLCLACIEDISPECALYILQRINSKSINFHKLQIAVIACMVQHILNPKQPDPSIAPACSIEFELDSCCAMPRVFISKEGELILNLPSHWQGAIMRELPGLPFYFPNEQQPYDLKNLLQWVDSKATQQRRFVDFSDDDSEDSEEDFEDDVVYVQPVTANNNHSADGSSAASGLLSLVHANITTSAAPTQTDIQKWKFSTNFSVPSPCTRQVTPFYSLSYLWIAPECELSSKQRSIKMQMEHIFDALASFVLSPKDYLLTHFFSPTWLTFMRTEITNVLCIEAPLPLLELLDIALNTCGEPDLLCATMVLSSLTQTYDDCSTIPLYSFFIVMPLNRFLVDIAKLGIHIAHTGKDIPTKQYFTDLARLLPRILAKGGSIEHYYGSMQEHLRKALTAQQQMRAQQLAGQLVCKLSKRKLSITSSSSGAAAADFASSAAHEPAATAAIPKRAATQRPDPFDDPYLAPPELNQSAATCTTPFFTDVHRIHEQLGMHLEDRREHQPPNFLAGPLPTGVEQCEFTNEDCLALDPKHDPNFSYAELLPTSQHCNLFTDNRQAPHSGLATLMHTSHTYHPTPPPPFCSSH